VDDVRVGDRCGGIAQRIEYQVFASHLESAIASNRFGLLVRRTLKMVFCEGVPMGEVETGALKVNPLRRQF
jgi:hypothetical protein